LMLLLDDTDRKNLVFNSDGGDKFTVKHGRRAEIPCKPTHPDVRVTLKRNNLFAVEILSKVSSNQKILPDPLINAFRYSL
jgi:hypothetical protein